MGTRRSRAGVLWIAAFAGACGEPPTATTLSGPPGRMLSYDGGLHAVHDSGAGGATPVGTAGAGGSSAVSGNSPGGGGSSAGAAGVGGVFDAGVTRRCTGVAWSCSAAPTSNCGSVLGCVSSGECQGVSSSCYSQYSSYSCISQEGCYWSTYDDSCSGSSWSCYLFSGSSSCVMQEGCYWHRTCEGVSTSCSLLTVATCTDQLGCYVIEE